MEILQSTIFALLASFAFMTIFEVRGKALLIGSIGGAISQLSYMLLQLLIDVHFLVPYFFATIILTLYSEIMARVFKKPATVYLIGALFPLVPGRGIYQSMVYFVEGQQGAFFVEIQETLAITGTLAMGIMLVSVIFRNFRLRSYFKEEEQI
ncbi:MAG: threonine/serine exporter family protein [Eubacteriales bacterium]|nr:threonine/serine exporter family protein [Eubacteriales bacterium]MDD4324263.1 threonine/serine exporter family protein [Eubacteriales bacterium]MDD4540909.1 threonine/serine exporter family protein [Eubacteriales bacterium]